MKRWPYFAIGLVPILVFWGLNHFFSKPLERLDPGVVLNDLEAAHIARYNFAARYCPGKTVADIASGTGYGMKILKNSAASVDGYDKEDFGNNHVIDLDLESWTKVYDVIVSLETIEHLVRPDFFVSNVRRTAKMLILSTPIHETPGRNPYHKQFFTMASLSRLLSSAGFSCEFWGQKGVSIGKDVKGEGVVAVCR